MKFKTIIVLFSLLLTSTAMAQTCVSEINETSPESNFTDNGDGTVTDTTTGLMWSRCSIGQTWDQSNTACTGDPTRLTWQEALQGTYGLVLASQNDWRLPNIKELSTITEKQCVRPSINAATFPQTPADDYWTSTPSVDDSTMAWSVAFFNSTNSLKEKDAFIFVRPVRFAN